MEVNAVLKERESAFEALQEEIDCELLHDF